MVSSIFYSGFGQVPDFIENSLPSLFSLTHQTNIDSFLQTFDLDTAVPTAVGSSLIRLSDGYGRTISIEGSNFGPITSATNLVQAFSNFRSAVEALDGSGTGTLSRITLSQGATELFRLTVSPTSWVAASGTDKITINGNLPTSLAQVNAAYAELTDALGALDPTYNPATSMLAGFQVNSVIANSGTATPVALTYAGNQMLLTGGDYELKLSGTLPLTFANFAKIAITLSQDGTNSGYTLSQGTVRKISTNTVLAQITGPCDVSQLLNLSSPGNDSIIVSALDVGTAELSLGSGNDLVRAAFATNIGLLETGYCEGGLGSDTYDFTGSTMSILAYLDDGYAPASQPPRILVNVGGAGSPPMFTSIGNGFENLTGGGLADTLIGNYSANALAGGNGNDSLSGGYGNDTLDGGAGADRLFGSFGNDTLITDFADVVVDGGDGFDTLRAGNDVGRALAFNNWTSIEQLVAGGGNDTITGSTGADIINGGAGNDLIDGRAGRDTMSGGLGDDVYVIDDPYDVVIELAGQGNKDRFATHISTALRSDQSIEIMTVVSVASTVGIGMVGNNFAQAMTGNNGNNALNGGGGLDVLTGNGGKDAFFFTTALGAGNVDVITDFTVADDHFRLENGIFTALPTTGTLSADAFWKGTAAHDATDRIIYNATTGALMYDADGNGAGAAIQFAKLTAGLALTNSHFLVI